MSILQREVLRAKFADLAKISRETHMTALTGAPTTESIVEDVEKLWELVTEALEILAGEDE